jgi:hypothetical protein
MPAALLLYNSIAYLHGEKATPRNQNVSILSILSFRKHTASHPSQHTSLFVGGIAFVYAVWGWQYSK